MQQLFRLARTRETGVSCDEWGLFVGGLPLLERTDGGEAGVAWRPRPLDDLNRELSRLYGFDIDALSKLAGLAAIARALERGNIAHAQLAALFLRLPEPPSLYKSATGESERSLVELAKDPRASGLLKANWDPAKHPRWPAGADGGVGGEFAPAGDAGTSGHAAARLNPHQIAVPFPGAIPEAVPRPTPFPGEIVAPPLVAPQAMPRNPYPADADCVEEWARATEYCRKLADRGLLGNGDYRRHGRSFRECVMGQVSERCGGNAVLA